MRHGISLEKINYARIRDTITGEIKIVRGACLYYMDAYEEMIGGKQEGESLGPTDYIRILNKKTGELKIAKGPTLWIPEDPFEYVDAKLQAVALKLNQYLKVLDLNTGVIRVEKGEALVYLSEQEEIIGADKHNGVRQAVNVDQHNAALVRNTETGQLRLVTEKKLFFPSSHEEIEKIQKKIVLQDHECVIMKDREGKYLFYGGRQIIKKTRAGENSEDKGKEKTAENEDPPTEKEDGTKTKKKKDHAPERPLQSGDDRSFFLPPYCELVCLQWYTSPDLQYRGHEVATVSRFDMRPQFMTYEFVGRTCDNVELTIDLTFFWEIDDIEKMIHKTDDLPSDICSHARSSIVQEISKVTLEKFMQEFNALIHTAILGRNDPFYEDRGAKIHTVEVRGVHCKDPQTEKVLQEIIKETTDRLNRLQKQSSENEVKLSKMRGDIEEEKMKGDLLKIKHDHHRAKSLMEGEAEADQIKAFLKGLNNATVSMDVQIAMWNSLKRLDGIQLVSKGNSQMYFTPNDINLSIEQLSSKPSPRNK